MEKTSVSTTACPMLHTSFLIPNLHCPTCITHITALLADFDPASAVTNVSLINHSVSIAHPSTTSAASISDLLMSAGHEVFDIILDPASSEAIDSPAGQDVALEDAVENWHPQQRCSSRVDESARLLHEATCQMCAAHSSAETNPVDGIVISSPNDKPPLYQAIFSVDGMTCSACVGNVVNALHSVKGVERADVSLVGRSSTVRFRTDGETKNVTAALIEAAEDIGYDVQLMEVKPVAEREQRKRTNESPVATRTVSLSIDGMHCPRCPKRVLEVIEQLEVTLLSPPTLESPTITLSYIPSAPDLTIRSIIHTLKTLDPSFTVTVHKAPTLEQRSRRMLAKEQRSIAWRTFLSLLAAIPSLIIGVIYMNLVPKNDQGYVYLMHRIHGVSRAEWALFVIATLVYFFATDHFHRRTIKELHALWGPRSPIPVAKRLYRFGSMNMLISLGTTIAYFSSLAEMIVAATSERSEMGTEKQEYFDSVVFLTMFLLLGRLAEARMKAKSGDAVAALGELRPSDANLVIQNGKDDGAAIERVNVDLIDTGDLVRIPNGASPPCDGILLDKQAEFDESSLTGESRIVKKLEDDSVLSGTINKGPAITIRVMAPAGASMLDSIIQVVREGQSKRAPVERVADVLTAYFVPVVLAIALTTWIIWLALGLSGSLPQNYLDTKVGGWPFWSLQFAIAVFVIACPCGLGLAAPTALFVGGGVAAKRGILVKGGGEAFQEASNLDVVVFDKTGTLTKGVEPKVVEHEVFADNHGTDKKLVLGMLKGVEENSGHPLARAAVSFAASEGADAMTVSTVEEIAGKGLRGIVEIANNEVQARYEVLVGNEALLADYNVPTSQAASALLESWKSSSHSVILLASRPPSGEWGLNAILGTSDPLRPEAASVVSSLQARGIEVWMLSGDSPKTAQAVGSQVGIAPDNIIAGVLPAQKADKVKYLQQALRPQKRSGFASGKRTRATIAMVGDGINDAPALATADIGIAVASGSDVAIQSAAFVLVHSDLRAVLTLVTLSRAVFRRVLFNFFWAALYNMIALPVAAGVLYPIQTSSGGHVRLDPAWAALAMALSSVSVVGSSLLLRSKSPWVGFRE